MMMQHSHSVRLIQYPLIQYPSFTPLIQHHLPPRADALVRLPPYPHPHRSCWSARGGTTSTTRSTNKDATSMVMLVAEGMMSTIVASTERGTRRSTYSSQAFLSSLTLHVTHFT